MTIATGIAPDTAISVQEYWLGGAAHYAVFNADRRNATLTLRAWRGRAPQETLAGPWELAAGAVGTFPLPAAETDAGSLWALVREDGETVGRLLPPIFPEGVGAEDQSRVLTNDGLNGTGEKLREVWCAQEALWLASGASTLLEWRVPTSPRKLRVPVGVPAAPDRAAITGVSCESLPVEVSGGQAMVDAGQAWQGQAFHRVRLSIQLPAVAAPTLVPVGGRITIEGGGAFPFQRGLLVRPEKQSER